MDFGLFVPLLVAGATVAILHIAASVMASRGAAGHAEKLRDVGFLVAMAAGAWVVVLLALVVFDFPNTFVDMITIMAVITIFFALLLGVLFLLFEVIFSRGPRRRRDTPSEP